MLKCHIFASTGARVGGLLGDRRTSGSRSHPTHQPACLHVISKINVQVICDACPFKLSVLLLLTDAQLPYLGKMILENSSALLQGALTGRSTGTVQVRDS